MWPLQPVHLLEILLLTLCLQATEPASDVEGGRSSSSPQQQKHNVLGPNLPKPEPLLGAGQLDTNLPIFPERPDAVYFIVAVKGGAKTWSRTLARTLLDMGAPFDSPQGPPLRPIYIDLPQNGRFSAKVLTSLCDQIEGEPIAGMVVIGEGHAARAAAMSGGAMKIPILWAKGGTANIHGLGRETQTQLQSMLQPSAREILEAIRALFLQTHWHTFFVISDVGATIVLGSSEGNALKDAPLVPTILPLQSKNDDVFRQLAQVSRSTRGVVLLLCDLSSARRVMTEAKRLNMAGGHFIWVWADTSSTTEFFDAVHIPDTDGPDDKFVDTDPEMDGMSKLRQEFNLDENYDHVDEHTSKHVSEILERRMEFEDFDPHYRRLNKTATRPGSNLNRFHHIIGLIDNKRSGEINFKSDKFLSDSVKVKVKRSNDVVEQHPSLSSKLNSTNRSKPLSFPSSSSVDNSKRKPFKETAPNVERRQKLYINRPSTHSDELTSHVVVDQKPLFDPNRSGARRKGANSSSSEEEEENVSEGGDTEDLKTTNTSEFSKSKRANYQKSPFNLTAPNSHVLFHHFKDFPVGFLALRPVKMSVDRHFVRAAIRLFAMTWAKVERDEELNLMSNSNVFTPNKARKLKDKITINWNEWSDGEGSAGQTRQQRRKMANSKENEEIYNETNAKLSRNKNERRYKRRAQSSNNGDDDVIAGDATAGTIKDNEGAAEGAVGGSSQDIVNSNQKHKVNKPVNSNVKDSNLNRNSNDTDNKSNNITNTYTNNNLTSVQKQIMSGLTLTKPNNYEPYESNNSNLNDKKLTAINKRQNTWWSHAGNSDSHQQHPQQPQLKQPMLNPIQRLHGKEMRGQRNWQPSGAPQYRGGCFGSPNRGDVRRAEVFAKNLQVSAQLALGGQKLSDGIVEKALITHFELLNLVPTFIKPIKQTRNYFHEHRFESGASDSTVAGATKWRRVGLVSGKSVHLDTIVWPGGDIVVSGLSARSRTIFRVVTALSPPFVMESDLDEDGQCLRGLPCHRLATSGKHNLTLMFNAIETRDRLQEDALDHGNQLPEADENEEEDKPGYRLKCCYGLSMDLLETIAEELGFEFHLYIVRDELFGTKFNNLKDWMTTIKNRNQSKRQHQHQYESDQRNKTREQQQQKKSFDGGIRQQFEPNFGANFDRSHHQKNRPPNQQPVDDDTANYVEERSYEDDARKMKSRWNGIMGDLIAGAADMSFAPLTVSKSRANVIDFSVPYFHSGVSLLAAPESKSEIPLLAFLLPFSPELWIAIFTSLNITAVAVAVYEWLSPFGLNPWGRQRSKNFSMSSALWVMWGLLCGHLVAFKAPKSWPNKFLINIWGGFSVIFIASYTANIAALIAGLFFQNSGNKYEAPLLTQRVGIATSTAAEYVQRNDKHLWEIMKKYSVRNIEEGIDGLKNGSIDLLMGDSPILDYYRGTSHGCSLQRIGDTYVEDVYAIGMTKGFPLKDSISALIAKYSSNGYLDILTEKWYGSLPCFKYNMDVEIVQPRPLGVAAVAGVFCLLGLGMVLGILILIFEHLFYKYTLPILRHKPKGTVWRSRNIMFFSQKLYRFINCVELVSPHHAARELVHTLKKGQITSLFQKSVKRKEDEQRRRRKSKAQFFEMIQEIRRVQQVEREQAPVLEAVAEEHTTIEIQTIEPLKNSVKNAKGSPRGRLLGIPIKKDSSRNSSKSSGLNVRRFSTDSILGERLDTIGRRLSRDITNSPPDLGHRFETFGKNAVNNKFDTFSGSKSQENVTTDIDQYKEVSVDNKFGTFSGKAVDDEEKPELPVKMNKKYQNRSRPPLNMDVWKNERPPLPPLKEKLYPPIIILDQSKHALRDKLHEELRTKYGPNRTRPKRSDGLYPKGLGEPSLRRASDTNGRVPKYQRNRSTESIDRELGRPTPSPRRSKRDLDVPLSLPPKISPRTTSITTASSNSNSRAAIALGRLSKEDLLMLSQSTESEIHEFLQNPSNGNKPAEPP